MKLIIVKSLEQLPFLNVGGENKITFPIPDANTPLLPTPFGRTRLLLGKVEQKRLVTGNTSPEHIPFEHKDSHHPKWAFPLLRDTLADFIERIGLPASTPFRIASTSLRYLSQHFLLYSGHDASYRTALTMKLPDSAIVGTTVSLAISHNSKAQLTEGIILCSSHEHLAQLTRTILLARNLTTHPLAIPILVMGWYTRVLNRKIESTWHETFKLETDSGQSGILLARNGSVITTTGNPNPSLLQPEQPPRRGTQSQLEINQRSVGLSQLACGWGHYAKVTVSLLADIEASFAHYDPDTHPDGALKEQTRALKERLRFLQQDAANLLAIAGYQRGRLELQNNAVNNQLALNLGTMMKYLAMLNLLFLPAACISVCFTPPFPFLPKVPSEELWLISSGRWWG